MGLTDQWIALELELAPGWGELSLELTVEPESATDQVAALLSPLQPLRNARGALAIRVTRGAAGPGPDALRRGLARLDERRLAGRLRLLGSTRASATDAPAPAATRLAEAWRIALAELPGDWSDLLGEIELASSDYLDRAAVQLAPLNPRRTGALTTLRFRSASRFGYGASAGMVSACLERCDRDGILGSLRVLRVLCDSRPVGTQGPVWQIDGEMV